VPRRPPRDESDRDRPASNDGAPTTPASATADDGATEVRIPIEIVVRVGTGGAVTIGTRPAETDREAVSIDPNYDNRRGYDPGFLGHGARVALPRLGAAMMADAALRSGDGADRHVLPYHHYSVVMSRRRRLAFVTAVNIDGRRSFRIARDPDRWFFDPRIAREAQAGNPVYASNDLDRGHLVRRLDPAWGRDEDLAKVANDDTFHFTNCTPQHKDFNQNRTTWAGLEDYILDNADNRNLKVSVFTGPVLADDDDQYRGIQLPREFWKVVVMVKNDGRLSATAYLLSQESLLDSVQEARRAKEDFSYGAYKTFQVPISRIEERTGLDFGSLKSVDPLDGTEAFGRPHEIEHVTDIRLG
jgi:endonuclease G